MISAKSSSADRFADERDDNRGGLPCHCSSILKARQQHECSTLIFNEAKARICWYASSLETKKKAVDSSAGNVDIVVAAPPTPVERPEPVQSDVGDSMSQQSLGIKNPLPSNFKGDRGGAAEDAELLAELRAISMNSSSSDRFPGESNDSGANVGTSGHVENSVAALIENFIMKSASQISQKEEEEPDSAELPPWKRGKKKPVDSSSVFSDSVLEAPSPSAKESGFA